MRVELRPDVCELHGLCADTAPEVFELGDQDEVDIIAPNDIDASLESRVREAVLRCPKTALRLVE